MEKNDKKLNKSSKLDTILDKITQTGIESLSKEEQKHLDNYTNDTSDHNTENDNSEEDVMDSMSELLNLGKNFMEEVKMFLFARWMATCYADEQLDEKMRYTDNEDFDASTALSALNRETGQWYREQLKYFNDVVYPNYIKNGTVDNTKEFLNI